MTNKEALEVMRCNMPYKGYAELRIATDMCIALLEKETKRDALRKPIPIVGKK